MVTEELGTGGNYPPLPTRDTRRESSALPATNLHLEQINKQLIQIIGLLQQLNNQIKKSQNEASYRKPLESPKLKIDDYNHKYAKSSLDSNELLKIAGRQRKKFRKIRIILLIMLIFGIMAALVAAVILFFYGPAMR